MVTRRRLLPAVLSGALLFTACTIPTSEEATTITSVPYGLQEKSSPTTAPPTEIAPTFKLVPYWGVRDELKALVWVERPTESAPSLQDAYDVLVAGPNDVEQENSAEFLITQVPASLNAQLPADPDENGVLTITIDVDSGFSGSSARELIGAQIVCTFLTFTSVNGVLVQDTAGDPVTLTGFGAVSIEGPATAADFNDCETVEEAEPVANS